MKLSAIAQAVKGIARGDGDLEITRVMGITEAVPGDLTFLSNKKYLSCLKTTRASAIILGHQDPEWDGSTIRVDYPYLAFAQAVGLFYRPLPSPAGIHPTASIAATARIGKHPSIQAYVSVGENVKIGDDVTIYPHVVIYPGVEIGNQVTIHAHSIIREGTIIGHRVLIQNGVVIGADGFGFVPLPDGRFYKIPQSGRVVIEDDVEIQSNTAIDRAAVGDTLIKKGAKLDNLVQVGHGCTVGENAILCGQVGLAGSAKVGNNVMLGGRAAVAGHLTIGDRVQVGGMSGVMDDVAPDRKLMGVPATDGVTHLKCLAVFHKLPDLLRRLRKLEKR